MALVTGGASGIGRRLRSALPSMELVVRIVDLNGEAAQKTAEQISTSLAEMRLHTRAISLTDAAQTAESISGRFWGSLDVDILVNSAGVAHVGRLETTE